MGRDSRVAFVRIGADDKGFRSTLKGSEKAAQTWAVRVKERVSGAFRDAFGGLGNVVGLGGVAAFAAMAREVKVFNDRLVRLAISSGRTRGQMLEFNRALQATAVETGVQADVLLAGAEKYQELTGRFGEFEKALGTFAKVAAATGADMGDLSAAAAALSDNLGVAPEQFLAVFDVLTAQGKAGAVELKNLAQEFAGLTGQFALFGAKGPKAAAELGAWLQVLRKGAPSASEAATQLQSLMNELTNSANVKALKQKGINVWADEAKGKLRDLGEITREVLAKIPVSKLSEIFGRAEARKALITMSQNLGMYEDLQVEAGKLGTINRDAAEWQESAGAKLARAQAKFKEIFNKAILDNADAMVRAFESIVKALQWIASHPEALVAIAALWKGGGALSALGALGGAAGGPGATGGLVGAGGEAAGGVGSIGARIAARSGAVMQGAAVGMALGAIGEKTGDALDSLGMAGTTAAGALVGFGGQLGMIGAAILAIKVVADFAMSAIDEKQRQIAEGKIGAFGVEQSAGLGELDKKWGREIATAEGTKAVTTGEAFDPKAYLAAHPVTPEMQASADFLMKRGKNEGLFDRLGNLDPTKLEAYIQSDKSIRPDERIMMRSRFQLTEQMMRDSPEMFTEFANYRRAPGEAPVGGPSMPSPWARGLGLGAPANDGGGFLGGVQRFISTATAPTPAAPQMGSFMGHPIEIKVTLEPGMKLEDERNTRRRSPR